MGNSLNGSSNNTDGRLLMGVDSKSKIMGDCIPDDTMKEVARRLVVFARDNLSDIIRSEDAPQDKSKLWYQPSTKKLFVWSGDAGQWVETNVEGFSVCLSSQTGNFIKRDEAGCLLAVLSSSEDQGLTLDEAGNLLLNKKDQVGFSEHQDTSFTTDGSGNATLPITIAAFSDATASILVTHKTDPGANGRFWITAQTASGFTLNFAGYSNSTTYAIRVTIRKGN